MAFQGISAEDRQIQEFQEETRRIEARRASWGYKLSEEAKAEIRTLVEQIVDERLKACGWAEKVSAVMNDAEIADLRTELKMARAWSAALEKRIERALGQFGWIPVEHLSSSTGYLRAILEGEDER